MRILDSSHVGATHFVKQVLLYRDDGDTEEDLIFKGDTFYQQMGRPGSFSNVVKTPILSPTISPLL